MPGMTNYHLDAITLADGTKVNVAWDMEGLAKPDVLPEMFEYYIVSDELYAQLAQPEREEQYYDWQVISGKDEDVVAAGEEISEQLLGSVVAVRSEEHTSELQSRAQLVCRLL